MAFLLKITHDVIRDTWINAHPDVCFDEGSQVYREYKDGCWSAVPDHEVESSIIELLIQLKNEAGGPNPTKTVATSVEYMIRRAITKPKEIWDARTNILVLKSKTLEWNESSDEIRIRLRKHSREDYATHKLDFDYDKSAKMPALKQILDAALPDKDSQRMLQEFVGYCLTTHTAHRVMLWIEGPSNCGKTTFLDAVVGMLGNENLAANVPIRATTRNFGLSHIPGATLFWSDEQSLARLDFVGRISDLVDGGDIRVEEKFKPIMNINSKGKVLWVMNKKPIISDPLGYNAGIWTRLNILRFEVNYDERDTSLYERAIQEKAGLLNWALVGLANLLARGEWLPCAESVRLVNEYKGSHAAVEYWLEHRTEAGEGLRVGGKVAYDDYKHWAYTTNRSTMRSQEFAQCLLGLGYQRRKSSPTGGSEWHGFALSVE